MDRRLFLAVCLAGLPGVAALGWLGVPALVAGERIPVPVDAARLGTMVQTGALLAIAAFAGTRLAPRIGLSAPVLAALAHGGGAWAALAKHIPAGLVGGLAGAAVLHLAAALAPDSLSRTAPLPLPVRLLYGGITEEILARWGLMTFLGWTAWRRTSPMSSGLPAGTAWFAIVASALVFGLAHLPAAAALAGPLAASAVAHVVAANAAFGIVAGYLYWRRGLEAAMAAHVAAHVAVFAISG